MQVTTSVQIFTDGPRFTFRSGDALTVEQTNAIYFLALAANAPSSNLASPDDPFDDHSLSMLSMLYGTCGQTGVPYPECSCHECSTTEPPF